MEYLFSAAVSALIGGLFGGSGVVYFMRRSFEKRIEAAESKQNNRKQFEDKRKELNYKLHHAQGRVFFWIIHGLKKLDTSHQYFNGELQKSFESLEKIEDEIKQLDIHVITEYEKGD